MSATAKNGAKSISTIRAPAAARPATAASKDASCTASPKKRRVSGEGTPTTGATGGAARGPTLTGRA